MPDTFAIKFNNFHRMVSVPTLAGTRSSGGSNPVPQGILMIFHASMDLQSISQYTHDSCLGHTTSDVCLMPTRDQAESYSDAYLKARLDLIYEAASREATPRIPTPTTISRTISRELVLSIERQMPGTTALNAETYLKKIKDSFTQINNAELFQCYTAQLQRFLETGAMHEKIRTKILDIFTTNILNVLQDVELPDSIKLLAVTKMPDMARILGKMFLNSSTLLRNHEGNNSYPDYEAASKTLKAKLIEDKNPSGVTFSARSLKLFGWTREEIAETANPLVGFLLQDPKCAAVETEVQAKFHKLFDIANLLVLQIACGDDIADNIQDEKLTRIFAGIPFGSSATLEDDRTEVRGYRRDIFTPYFDIAVTLWTDAVVQLEALFGREYFKAHVEPEFLEIHREVMGSLTYSQYMNSRPHNPDITAQTISDNLDPNIMVKCVRYLEKSLVIQIARTQEIELPEPTDIAIVDQIVSKSQKNAAASNAAATAPRERRENDFSSPFPFEMNAQYNQALLADGKNFITEFEDFIRKEGYSNHFFATYFEEAPPANFDYLSLLVLRREALTQVIEQLERVKQRGFHIPESDYSVNSLAVVALKTAQASPDENIFKGSLIGKLKRHIDLIDKFSEHLSMATRVQDQFFKSWEREIQAMQIDASELKNETLKTQTLRYIESWEVFLCMYLIFKRTLDGTI